MGKLKPEQPKPRKRQHLEGDPTAWDDIETVYVSGWSVVASDS